MGGGIPGPQTARGWYGMAVRHHGPDSVEADEARQVLAEAKIAAHIRKVLGDLHSERGLDLQRAAKHRLVALIFTGVPDTN